MTRDGGGAGKDAEAERRDDRVADAVAAEGGGAADGGAAEADDGTGVGWGWGCEEKGGEGGEEDG